MRASFLCALLFIGAAHGGSLQVMLDVMARFSTGSPYDRQYYTELTACWNGIDPTLLETQDRMWQGFLNYSAAGGSPAGNDPWPPNLGCKGKVQNGWFETNYSEIGGARNITICEPCNFNSNLAFYRGTTRVCARDKLQPWALSPAMKRAVVRAMAVVTAGSAFMHGSETILGEAFDTRGETMLPWLAHQAAIAQLPEGYNTDPVLRDFNQSSQPTGIEQMDSLTQTFNELPAQEWLAVIEKLSADLTPPIAGIVGSWFSLAFPPVLVDTLIDAVVILLKNVVDLKDIIFLKDHFIPTFRNATAHLHLSLPKKLEIAKIGMGSFVKFLYAIVWQEQIIDAHKHQIILKPWFNSLGAKLMPHILQLADWLTRFPSTDSTVRHCGDDVYPGAGWCRPVIPHAKWHELDANAFFDLVSFGEYLGQIYSYHPASNMSVEAGGRLATMPNNEQVRAFNAVIGNLTAWAHRVVNNNAEAQAALDSVGDSLGWLASRFIVNKPRSQQTWVVSRLVEIQSELASAQKQRADSDSASVIVSAIEGAQSLIAYVLSHIQMH